MRSPQYDKLGLPRCLLFQGQVARGFAASVSRAMQPLRASAMTISNPRGFGCSTACSCFFHLRCSPSSCWEQIQDTLAELVPIKQKELAALKKEHGNKVIGEVTVDQVGDPRHIMGHDCIRATSCVLVHIMRGTRLMVVHALLFSVVDLQCIGGSRDIKSMLWETSLLDAQEVRSWSLHGED